MHTKRVGTAVRMLAAVSMALSMLAALSITTSAADNPAPGAAAYWDMESLPPILGAAPSDDVCAVYGCIFGPEEFNDGIQEVYFPSVGNADNSAGLGDAQTSITINNLYVNDAYIFVFVGTPEDNDGVDLDNWDMVEYAYLSGGASKTFQASDLEIPAGEFRPVVVVGYNEVAYDEEEDVIELTPVALAGVAKQAAYGESLPFTSPADVAVSGYNAIGGRELGYFDQLYFPIVQTNCGPGGCWNSILRIANMGADDNAAVTVRFFPADDGSGSLQTGFQLQDTVDVGETWAIDLSAWVPQGWVGSAHVYTDDAVGAIVDRVKVGTDMWITNTAANANYEVEELPVPGAAAEVFPTSDAYPYVLFAPDVRTDYNGWNTGINVANTVEEETDVSIQYFGSNGNAPAAQTRRLAAHGMTYFYYPSDPSEDRCEQPTTDVPGCEYIGGAVILSSNPVAVAVDGVKYFGNDNNVGQAFSYAATANAFYTLHAALVQKGNPANGMGATSGINFMNPNEEAATVETIWLNPSGFEAENFGSSIVWVPAYSTGFVYTMFHNNLPNGYVGSAVVLSDQLVVATTANVDYQVNGDGTAIYNLSNPCGFFRQTGECVFQSPLEPSEANATITKTVVVDDPFDAEEGVEPLANVLVSYEGADLNGFPFSGSGRTGANGSVTFAVPGGVYDIEIEDLPDAPAGFEFDGPMLDEMQFVDEGDALSITNTLTLAISEGNGRLTKILEVENDEYTSLASEVHFCAGVFTDFDLCAAAAIVTGGYGEGSQPDMTVSAEVPAGQYTICTFVEIWFDNGNGVDDPEEYLRSGGCESTFQTEDPTDIELPIIVTDNVETTVINDFDADTFGAALDVYVRNDDTDEPIAGAEVCLYRGSLEAEPLCSPTSSEGRFPFTANAGTYYITVSAEGYEQESTVIEYVPSIDIADGAIFDSGMDSDVVVSLDPAMGVLDIFSTHDGAPSDMLYYLFEAHPDDNAEFCGLNGGGDTPYILLGFTDAVTGEAEEVVQAGDYCVQSVYLIGGGGPAFMATTVTVTSGDPNTDEDVLHARTGADPVIED